MDDIIFKVNRKNIIQLTICVKYCYVNVKDFNPWHGWS